MPLMTKPKFAPAISACINHGKELLGDAGLLLEHGRHSTALAISILAQEEFAKAFGLVLVQEEVVPWSKEVSRLLHNHECKHLLGVIMEWLNPSLEEALDRSKASINGEEFDGLPHEVSVAINILRHEKLEQFRSGWSWRESEWNGVARKIAKGARDKVKQNGFYVGLSGEGVLGSHPSRITAEMAEREICRARTLQELASDAFGNCVLSHREYRYVKEIIGAVFSGVLKNKQTA